MSDLFSLWSDCPLSLLCLAIGTRCEMGNLKAVVGNPDHRRALVGTLLSTLLLLPACALAILKVVPDVPPEGVLGILTISLIPGGPLANIVAVLIGAKSELNVVLTSTEMLLCTVMLPIGLLWVYPHTFSTQQVIKVPYTEMLYGMMLVLPPLLLGLVLGEGVVRHTEPATHAWRRRRVFQLIILIAAIAYVADRQLEPDRQEASILSQIPDIVQAGSVPPATAVAAVAVGVVTVAWSIGLGYLVPGQSRANRMSICLEVGVRDVTIALAVALAGLPSLSARQRAHVSQAVLITWGACNGGVVVGAYVMALCHACNGGGDDADRNACVRNAVTLL